MAAFTIENEGVSVVRMMEMITDNSLDTFCCAVEYTQDKRFPVNQCADKCLASTFFQKTPLYKDI